MGVKEGTCVFLGVLPLSKELAEAPVGLKCLPGCWYVVDRSFQIDLVLARNTA